MANELKGNAPLVQVEHLKKYFQVGRGKVLHAVDDVTFSIPKGTTLGLVGESGCGKTTVGRTLVGLYEPDGGKITFDGQDITHSKREEKRAITRRMQMVYQDPYASLNPFFTVGEIITEGAGNPRHRCSKKERMEIAYDLLETVGLHREHANRFPHEFSGGQRQRVGLARSLAVEPRASSSATRRFRRWTSRSRPRSSTCWCDFQQSMGLTYLFIAHDLSMVRYISDRTAVMYLGPLVEIGDIARDLRPPGPPLYPGALTGGPGGRPRLLKRRGPVSG